MSSASTFQWFAFPNEMKQAVLSQLTLDDIWACARTDHESYKLCLPFLFETVRLNSLQSLVGFLEAVPVARCSLIRHLAITSASDDEDNDLIARSTRLRNGDPLLSILFSCGRLESLSLNVGGVWLRTTLLPIFEGLRDLKSFTLENVGDESSEPISERLAVSLAFSLPRLEELSLIRITRSARHAPDLHLSNVPTVQGDDDVPAHSLLGEELRLPQLLRLSSLKHLKIRDTHLGDPHWEGPSLDFTDSSQLEVIDLGSCPHICPTKNETFAARILSRVPSSITSCSLSTSLPPLDMPSPSMTCSSGQSSPGPISPISGMSPMPKLQTIHLTPLVPTSAINSTLSQPALAGSPVHTLNCSFYPDDAADGCAALEAFLLERSRAVKFPIVKSGRKRASTGLSTCTPAEDIRIFGWDSLSEEPESVTEKLPAFDDAPVTPSPMTASVLYPSLSKLMVDIPQSPLKQTGTKLSARRLAAAKRREEERKTAVLRLQALARELGLELILRGVELTEIQTVAPTTTKTGLRARANTTF